MACDELLLHEDRVECFLERAALAAEQAAGVGALADFMPVVLVLGFALLALQLSMGRR